MSGNLAEAESDRAKTLEIKFFEKPFGLDELDDWVKIVENEIPENRVLTDWDFVDKR